MKPERIESLLGELLARRTVQEVGGAVVHADVLAALADRIVFISFSP